MNTATWNDSSICRKNSWTNRPCPRKYLTTLLSASKCLTVEACIQRVSSFGGTCKSDLSNARWRSLWVTDRYRVWSVLCNNELKSTPGFAFSLDVDTLREELLVDGYISHVVFLMHFSTCVSHHIVTQVYRTIFMPSMILSHERSSSFPCSHSSSLDVPSFSMSTSSLSDDAAGSGNPLHPIRETRPVAQWP